MKRILNLLMICILCSFPCLFAQEVVELNLPRSNKIIIKLMFKNGSISDPAGKEGLTQLTSSLIAQGGTKDLTYSEIQDKIYPMASNYGSAVDKEVSNFTFQVHKDFLAEFYPIIKGLMLTPSFTEEDFNRVKIQQQNYVDQVIRASSDEEYSKKALEDFLFRETNYQHMISGKSKSVASITLDDVKQHYKNYFTRNNVVIGIAGNYSQEFLNRLKTDVGQLSDAKPNLSEPGKAAMPNGIRVEIVAKDNTLGSAIFAGYPIDITRSDDEFAALMVANSYLGEHRKSYGQLYKKIRSDRSMNYGDYTYIEWYDRGGSFQLPPSGVPRSSNYFSLWIRPVQTAKGLKQQYNELKGIKIGHAHYALRLAFMQIDKLIKEGMTQEDFELTRTFLRSYIKLYIQTPANQLGFLMDSKFYGREDYIKELDALLAKVTLEDVNKAVRKYLQIDNMCITIVTDKSEAKPLSKSLKANLKSPMSYANVVKQGLPGSILEEDAEAEKFKLNVKSVKIVNSADTFQ